MFGSFDVRRIGYERLIPELCGIGSRVGRSEINTCQEHHFG